MFFRPLSANTTNPSLRYFFLFFFPLPTLANKDIRDERMKVHKEFANIARIISRGQIGGGGAPSENTTGMVDGTLVEKACLEGWGA